MRGRQDFVLEPSAQEADQAAADGCDLSHGAGALEDAQAAAVRKIPLVIEIQHDRDAPLIPALRLIDVPRIAGPGSVVRIVQLEIEQTESRLSIEREPQRFE